MGKARTHGGRRWVRSAATWSVVVSSAVVAAVGGGQSNAGDDSGPPTSVADAETAASTVPPLSEMTTLTANSTGGLTTSAVLPYIIAETQGFFEEENLDLEFTAMQSSEQGCDAIISGSTSIGLCTLNNLIPRNMAGADLVMFNNDLAASFPYALVARPEFTTVNDLAGETIMDSGPAQLPRYLMKLAAEGAGLTVDDFEYAVAGSSAARFAALQEGSIAATWVSPPLSFVAVDAGYTQIVRTTDLPELAPEQFAGGGWVTTRSWADENLPVVAAFNRAELRAIEWFYDPANRDAALDVMTDAFDLEPALAERMYDYLVEIELYSRDLCPRPAAVAGFIESLTVLEVVDEDGDYPPEQYAPTDYVEATTGVDCS